MRQYSDVNDLLKYGTVENNPHPSSLPLLCLTFYSVAVCRFTNTGDDWYVLVGVARDMILNPRSVGSGFIYTYRLTAGGEKLEFVHKVGLVTRKLNRLPTVDMNHFSMLSAS